MKQQRWEKENLLEENKHLGFLKSIAAILQSFCGSPKYLQSVQRQHVMRWEQTITLIQVLEAYIENITLSLVQRRSQMRRQQLSRQQKVGYLIHTNGKDT